MNEAKLLKIQKGFGLVEILVVTAIIAVGFLSLVSFLIFSRGVTFQANRTTRATQLAEEALEAVRKMRADSWATNIAPLVSGTTYYPTLASNVWTLSTTNPGVINNLFTRTVVVTDVARDVNANIATSGTNDPNTQKVVSTVSWTEDGRNKSVVLTTYITNFLNN